MKRNIRQWAAHIGAAKQEMNSLTKELEQYGANVQPQCTPVVSELPYHAQFYFPNEETVVNIFFNLKDWQTDSDVVITHITTLPPTKTRQGFGSKAVQQFLRWAAKNNLLKVRATQISGRKNERFWVKNGFMKDPEPNPCNDFIQILTPATSPA